MKNLLVLLLTLFVSSEIIGQTQNMCQSIEFADIVGQPQTVPVDIPTTIHNKLNYWVSSTKVKIRVAIEEDGVFPYGDGDNFLVNFDLTGDILDKGGNSILPASISESVSLSQTEPEVVYYVELPKPNVLNVGGSNDPYNLLSSTQLYSIANVLITPTATIPIPTTQLKVEICYEMDIMSGVGRGSNSSILYAGLKINSIPTPIQNSSYYNFKWESMSADYYYPYYEFQLLKLENTSLERPLDEEEIETKEDWSKALSFVIPEDKIAESNGVYTLHFKPSEGTGYYLWRVRPIGNYYDGGVANNQNWGAWNNALYTNAYKSGTNIIALNSNSTIYNDCFFYTDPDEDDNYIYSRTFTEDGQVYENITYADKLLRTRQTQSYLPAENKTLVGQTLYDHLGRSSISVIPVPVEGKMYGYKDNFVQNSANDLYTQEDFATDDKVFNPNTISTDGAYSYYSPNNPDVTIPDAEGYPFTRTLYSTDGLNRVIEQSGIGKTHMVGALPDRGRTTKTNIQVGVDDAELVSIFGIEAPNPDKVTKQIIVDPNGTTSITYLSATGKTLATAIAAPYDPQESYQLESLDNSTMNELTITESLDIGDFKNDRFVSSKEFDLIQPVNNLQFTYESPGCTSSSLPACISTSNCNYEVVIRVVKYLIDPNDPIFNFINDPDVLREEIYTNESSPLQVTACSTVAINTGVALERGTYMIIKEVKPLGSTVGDAIDAYQLQVEDEIVTYMSLIGLLLDEVSDESDWPLVEQAVNHIADYIATPSPTDLYNDLNSIPLYTGVFDNFVFTDLTGFAVSDISYAANTSSSANQDDIDKIQLEITHCDGTTKTNISSEIEARKETFRITRTDYTYNGIGYDYPPFMEYFIEEIGADIYNDPNQSNSIFYDFFKGYKYWDQISSTWVDIDDGFVAKYLDPSATQNDLKVLNANQFNRMIWHMLQDEYYGGQVRYDATNDQYLYYDENTTTWNPYINTNHIEYQYEVEELKECWENTFGPLSKFIDPAIQGAIGDGVTNNTNDIDDSVNNSNAGNDAYEDKMNEHIPWLIKFFFGNQLDDQMTNDQSNGGVQPVFSSMPINSMHLAKKFLNCTGYKYARIVDPAFANVAACSLYASNPSNPHGTASTIGFNTYDMPLKGNSSIDAAGYLGIPGYVDEMVEYYSNTERTVHNGNHDSHTHTDFPFTQNLVFAFKYYEYWGRSFSAAHPWDGDSDKNGNLLSISTTLTKPFSCLMCEASYSYSVTAGNACQGSSFGHDEWPWKRRYIFSKCVRNMSNNGDLPQDDNVVVNNNVVEVNANCNELPDSNAIENACRDNCESRRDEFRSEVIQIFEDACYAVGQCSTQNANYITMEEVEAIVDAVIDECKSNCGITILTNPVQCVDIGGAQIHYCRVQVGTTCELISRDIVQNWKLELFVTPASGCTNTVPATGTPAPCTSSTANETEVIQLTIPQNP